MSVRKVVTCYRAAEATHIAATMLGCDLPLRQFSSPITTSFLSLLRAILEVFVIWKILCCLLNAPMASVIDLRIQE